MNNEDEKKLLIYELEKLYERYNTKIYDVAFKTSPLTSKQDSDATWWNFYERRLLEMSKKIEVEKGKNYWITFDNNGEDFTCLLGVYEKFFLYHKSKDFRYTHYINYWGCNLNQMNVDYINDAVKYKTPVALSGRNDEIIYLKIKSLKEIKNLI